MHFRLDPQVAGELGEGTRLDGHSHPPTVDKVDYVLDGPDTDDLVQSFPVFLVTIRLGRVLLAADLTGFSLAEASVRPGDGYTDAFGEAPHRRFSWLQVRGVASQDDCWLDSTHLLCVSARMMDRLQGANLSNCTIEEVST